MKIDIKHLSNLCKLKLSESEIEKFENQLDSIVDMIKELPDITLDFNIMDESNPMTLRKDEVISNYKRDDILKNAPEIKAGCIVVPSVID